MHHNRDLALQKYLLLQDQHESLRQHLDELRPLYPSSQSERSISLSVTPSGSPTRSGTSASPFASGQTSPRSPPPAGRQRPHHRRSSLPVTSQTHMCPPGLETVLEATNELAAEEAKLFDVNEGIKRALTELLNCEAVRSDRALRTWVQCRLMDTEKELRSGRRRRSNPETVMEA
ncbi:hypothetical protein GQ53DRAFT_779028 [Thozetella sp. PMI_491]|nr:hypothetical protein GQ53DRAFT_779028 [Thozetella sp. PMI_491]